MPTPINAALIPPISQLIFGLCLFVSHLPAIASEGNLPLEIKRYPRQLQFSRHDLREPGTHDHQVKRQEYSEVQGGFVGGSLTTRLGYGYRDCETLLHEQQSYAIDKMGNTSYLEKEEAEFYKKLGSSISPSQVSFFEMMRNVPHGEPVLAHLQERNRTPEYLSGDPFERVRTASLWSVAGQRLNIDRMSAEFTPLPWQLEREWAAEAPKLDRSKHKLVWEWGRAAQDVSGDIEPLYRANAMALLKEVLAANRDIDSAYVMFHSLKKVNTILYERAFPNSRFASKSDDNVLFLVPLRKVLERYPPSSVSKQVADIKAIAPNLSDINIVKIMSEYRNLFWDELDFYHEGRLMMFPIVASEWSQIVLTHSLIGILAKFGIPEKTRALIANYLIKNTVPSHHTSNLGQYVDVVDVPTSAEKLFSTDTFQISNIPAEIASKPKLVLRTLIGAYYHKLKQLVDLEQEPTHQVGELTHARLTQQQYKIAISTWDKKFAERLQSLGGELVSTQLPTPDFSQSDEESNVGDFWMFRAHFQPQYTVSFSMKTLYEIALAQPQIDIEANGALRQGWHQINYKLKQFELL